MMPVKKLNRLPGVFSDLFYDQWPEVFTKRGQQPAINVIETDKKFKVEIAAPGMTKDGFRVELNADNQLIVCMEKRCDEGDKKDCCMEKDCDSDEKHQYLRHEFSYASCRQVFNLPESIDQYLIGCFVLDSQPEMAAVIDIVKTHAASHEDFSFFECFHDGIHRSAKVR